VGVAFLFRSGIRAQRVTVVAAGLLATATLTGSGGGAPVTTRLASSPAPAPVPAVSLEISVSGDLLMHSPLYQRALALGRGRRYDFAPMLRAIKPYVAGADLAVCHVETPMGPGPPHGFPLFNTPADLARAIRATGWDACDTASNHSLDGGQPGVDATGAALARAGVRHTGSFASAAAQRRPLILRVKGVRVALLAYTEMTNGIPLPHPWSVNLASAPRILADARRARRKGAQVVIVNLHWGTENQSAPSAFQRRLADALTASGEITAVVGQHVHVVQPIRWIHGKPVVFGEGNLLSSQTAACCAAGSQDGLIALLDLRVAGSGVRAVRVRYLPTYVRHPDYTIVHARGRSRSRTIGIAGRSSRVVPIR
jgi:poly-gamma-glutamate synthesis protein (capsule biosynthesis protein)